FVPFVNLASAGYQNDGVVPIQSARFDGASIDARRQVDGSCDHSTIYLNLNTVTIDGVTESIFDAISSDLQSSIPVTPKPVINSVSPATLAGLPLPQTQR